LLQKFKISIIGLGYVGLPLALEFSNKFKTLGFDINSKRVNSLKNYKDFNNEISSAILKKYKNITFTNDKNKLEGSDFFIITVPTPVKKNNKPNLEPIFNANKIISKYINKNSIIIYESTVYPGCTEDIFARNLENLTNFEFNKDFFVGYSPERINPGDTKHNLKNIVKLVSGSSKESLKKIIDIYSKIIHKVESVKSIKVAEAAKVIENTQRDVNVALMNELYEIFEKDNLDFRQILNAAKTKWNFLNFYPGFVGGHCISVDPYYLIDYAKNIKAKSKIIINSRRINDNFYKLPINKIKNFNKIKNKKLKILVCGITFKDDVSDTRNSQALKIVNALVKLGHKVFAYDPLVENDKSKKSNFKYVTLSNKKLYEVVLILRNHQVFKKNKNSIVNSKKKSGIFLDYSNGFLDKKDCYASF
jgi:UDP-N-acetyl-D-galactosamine dehydrogenase